MRYPSAVTYLCLGTLALLGGLMHARSLCATEAVTEALTEELRFQVIDLPDDRTRFVPGWSLLPMIHIGPDGSGTMAWPVDDDFESERLLGELVVDVIRETVQPEQWETSGRMIDFSSEGKIYVKAPRSVVDETQRFVGFLTRRLLHGTELRVTVYDILSTESGTLAELSHATMDADDANRRVARAVDSGVLEESMSRTLVLRPGAADLRESFRTHRLVLDYDVEIAHRAVIQDPVVATVAGGVSLMARVTPALAGGVGVELSIYRSRVDEISTNSLDFTAYLGGDNQILSQDMPRRIQSADVRFCSLLCGFYLPAGQTTFLRGSSELYSGADRQLIRVDVSSGEEEEALFKLSSGRVFGAFTRGAGALGGMGVSGGHRSTLDVSHYADSTEHESAHVIKGWFDGDDVESLGEMIHNVVGLDDTETRMWVAGPWLLAQADAGLMSTIREMVADLERPSLSTGLLSIELLQRSGEGGARELARLALPVSANTSFSAASGTQWTEVVGWDVEVAQQAAISDPYVGLMYDGLLAQGRVGRLDRSGARVHLRGKLHLMRTPPTVFDSEQPSTGEIVQPSFQSAFVDRILDLAPGRAVEIAGLGTSSSEDLVLRVTMYMNR